MPATGGTILVHYDTWANEYGTLGARQAGQLGAGWFHAKNLQRYRNGHIGPRAGLRAYAFTGLSSGVVHGFGWAGTTGSDLWFAQGTALRLLDSAGFTSAVQAVAGTLASTPTRPLQWVEGPSSRTYIANYGDKLYYLDHVAKTLTAIVGSPAAGCLTFYGDRLIAAGNSANPNRVFYSDAAAYSTFGAGSYFDVGDAGGQIRGLFVQRGHLVIVKQDGTWWVLTGVPGVNDTLRRVTGGGVHPWHLHANSIVGLGDDRVMFVPISAGWPAAFDGARVAEKRHLDFLDNDEVTPDSPLFVRAVRGFRNDEYAIVGGSGDSGSQGRALLYRNGVDTFHDFDQSPDAYVASDAQGHVFLCDGGSGGAAPKFWAWDVHLDRPAFATDTYARDKDGDAGSTFDAFLHLPEWRDPGDREVQVRSVVVDFTKWNTGSAQTNHFEVAVDALDRLNVDGPKTSATQSFDEAAASASTSGTRARKVVTVGDQGSGLAFQVRLTQMRGVTIERVTVVCDLAPGRSR